MFIVSQRWVLRLTDRGDLKHLHFIRSLNQCQCCCLSIVMVNEISVYVISGFLRSANEIFALLECYEIAHFPNTITVDDCVSFYEARTHSRVRCLLHSSCLRPPTYISAAPTGRISLEWYWGLLWTPVEKIHICLKSGKNIGQLTWRSKCVLLLRATLKRHKSALFCWNTIRLFVRLSFYPLVSALLPPDELTWNLISVTFMELCREYPDLAKIAQK